MDYDCHSCKSLINVLSLLHSNSQLNIYFSSRLYIHEYSFVVVVVVIHANSVDRWRYIILESLFVLRLKVMCDYHCLFLVRIFHLDYISFWVNLIFYLLHGYSWFFWVIFIYIQLVPWILSSSSCTQDYFPTLLNNFHHI